MQKPYCLSKGRIQRIISKQIMEALEGHVFRHIKVGLVKGSHIGHIELNRPEKSNAFDAVLWEEFPRVGEEWQGG